jgi:nitrate/nitrite transporter NarK
MPVMDATQTTSRARFLTLFALILSGEMIFSLPFHLPRYFRPSVLETFNLSNANLGDIFALYGITAMLAYFPGGLLADRIVPRKLMAASLAATALGGVYLMTLPGHFGLRVLYAYWGVTTIFMFWAAMIRATRQWGGSDAQGRAFGLLEGGRGLAAAGFASITVACFALMLPAAGTDIGTLERQRAMQLVIAIYSAITFLVAVLVWVWLPDQQETRSSRVSFSAVVEVLRRPLVWLQALVVVCAYCGYKGLDNYALYAHEVLGMSEVESAGFTASAAYLRPLAAVGAGYIADRVGAARSITALFLFSAVSYLVLALADAAPATASFVYANIIVTFVAVFALRAVYFALLEETRVPPHLTGTTVGLVSVIGYTPDIFFLPVAGRLLDGAPGLTGHQHYFWFLTGIAIVGLVVAGGLAHVTGKARRGAT